MNEFVQSVEEIASNIITLNRYLAGSESEKKFSKTRLKNGKLFVALANDAGYLFAPSKFAGYRNNDIRHAELMFKRDGRETNIEISKLLGHFLTSDHPRYSEVDGAFIDFCKTLEITPSAHHRERRFWLVQGVGTFRNPEEVEPNVYVEGAQTQITVNSYERNADARAACINYYGCFCSVCGFDFEKVYGEVGGQYIHVHHIVPISSIRAEYKVDPINDLRPVCPNCHAMLHRKQPVKSIEELRTSSWPEQFEMTELLTWQIGDVKITRVVESEIPVPHKYSFLKQATPQALREMPWLYPHFVKDDGSMVLSIHALLVDAPGLKLVVDTCIGNYKARALLRGQKLQTDFLKHIAEAGFPRESVNTVVCTHLHVDHVGWNTMLDGETWVPTFPNARYLIGKTEYEHWMKEPEGETAEIMNDSVKPIFDAGLAQTVEMDHRISPEIRLVPTPGHTPGHVSVMIESKGEAAVITGDMIHHPCQFARPDWLSAFDGDQSAANARRHTMFAQWADKPILVIGTHFAAPTAGHVHKDGNTYRFSA